MNQRDAVQRMVHAIEQADIEMFAELFAENATMHHPLAPGPLEGRAAIRESEQALFEAFSHIEIEIVSFLSSNSSAAVEVVLRATHTGPFEIGPEESIPATNRRVELPAAWFIDFDEGGRVLTERDYFDTAAFMSQLGLNG
jgi:steroid delta-isomerase-like uncharacterized protein